jgi:hypothetical protein
VFFLIGVACAVACAAAPAALAVTIAPGNARLRPPKPKDCQKALDPGQRMISVTAVMHSLPGAQQLQLKFVLLAKATGASAFSAVQGGDLGTWISPQDSTLGSRPQDVWVLHHPVADLLVAPAVYRFQVSFRWIGAHKRVLGTLVRNGPRCYQPELRPDLQVQGVTVTPNDKGTKDLYDATIYNGGLTKAGPFIVDFNYQDPMTGTLVVAPLNVAGLGRHKSVVLEWVGPVCKASAPPTIIVDPAGQVDDYNTTNNTYMVVCPS